MFGSHVKWTNAVLHHVAERNLKNLWMCALCCQADSLYAGTLALDEYVAACISEMYQTRWVSGPLCNWSGFPRIQDSWHSYAERYEYAWARRSAEKQRSLWEGSYHHQAWRDLQHKPGDAHLSHLQLEQISRATSSEPTPSQQNLKVTSRPVLDANCWYNSRHSAFQLDETSSSKITFSPEAVSINLLGASSRTTWISDTLSNVPICLSAPNDSLHEACSSSDLEAAEQCLTVMHSYPEKDIPTEHYGLWVMLCQDSASDIVWQERGIAHTSRLIRMGFESRWCAYWARRGHFWTSRALAPASMGCLNCTQKLGMFSNCCNKLISVRTRFACKWQTTVLQHECRLTGYVGQYPVKIFIQDWSATVQNVSLLVTDLFDCASSALQKVWIWDLHGIMWATFGDAFEDGYTSFSEVSKTGWFIFGFLMAKGNTAAKSTWKCQLDAFCRYSRDSCMEYLGSISQGWWYIQIYRQIQGNSS